jgi:hypothetical protein
MGFLECGNPPVKAHGPHSEKPTQYKITTQVGQVSQTVDVTTEAPTVGLTSSTLSAQVSGATVRGDDDHSKQRCKHAQTLGRETPVF